MVFVLLELHVFRTVSPFSCVDGFNVKGSVAGIRWIRDWKALGKDWGRAKTEFSAATWN
jgi:hypothetical protein